jgi:ABC-type branched-subunit amino acid transport system substrate-binding protein
MKRSHLLRLMALLGVFALLAAACGGSDKDDEGASDDSDEKKELVAAPGFDLSTIKVGVITPLTGPVAVIGNPLTAGTETWFNYINQEKGGIAGKYKVTVVKEDSQYKPDLGVQAYNKIKGDVSVFAQLLGTPITKAVRPRCCRSATVAARPW